MKKFFERLNFYLQKTTLHGFAYTASSQSWSEKVFWLLALFSSFSCCFFLVYELYAKVWVNPIIFQQPDKPVYIKDIPFPAISFCAASLINEPYDMYASLLMNNSYTYPYPEVKWKNSKNVSNWQNLLNYLQNGISFRSIWVRRFRTHPNFVISPFGWCRTFNVVEYEEIFNVNTTAEYFRPQQFVLESGVFEDFEYDRNNLNVTLKEFAAVAPLYTSSKTHGLYTPCLREIVYSNDECPEHPNCESKFLGTYTIVIHSPFEYPDERHQHFEVMDYKKYILNIAADIKKTHETILATDLEERECYKEGEKKLKVFKTYTKVNCLRECESSFILAKCGCVPYYFLINDTALICSTQQISNCFRPEHEKFNETACTCYPSCEELTYNVDVQTSEFSSLDGIEFFTLPDSMIVAYFKEDGFYPRIRRKYFTLIDWFSFVGGILGLFFGFSFLSAFEFLFHVYLSIFGRSRLADGSRWKRFRKLRKYVRTFMDDSSVHGFGYISDGNLRIFERTAWLASFILSISACIFMIVELKQKLTIDSISIVSSDTSVNLTNFPFPAVTVIHFGVPHREPNNATFEMKLLETSVKFLIGKLGRNINYNDFYKKFWNHENLPYIGHKLVPYILEHQQLSPNILPWMAWNEEFSVPGQRILTSKGLVYDFNMVKAEEMFQTEKISPDFLYTQQFYPNGPKNLSNQSIPWHPTYSGDSRLFMRILKLFFIGQTIFLHSPFEYPFEFVDQFSSQSHLRLNKIVDVSIVPEIITTDDDLKSLPVEQRKCYLDNEKRLEFFKVYTQRNCQIECLSREMFKACACIPFDMVRSNDTKVCEIQDENCYAKVRRDFTFDDETCRCLQPCDFYSYSYEFVQSDCESGHKDKKVALLEVVGNYRKKIDLESTKWKLGAMNVRFKEKEFTSMQRVRQFTVVDFLSYVGGLLGLFAGISVLTLFEIFYFFTLRLVCEIFKYFKERNAVSAIQIGSST